VYRVLEAIISGDLPSVGSARPATNEGRLIQVVAQLVRRFPGLAKHSQVFYRRFQPRFTAGAVGVLLDDQERVLLVEHVFHARHPWGLPGGWVGRNELPSQAVEREFLEETGLAVKTLYPLEVWSSRFWRNHIDLAFAVQSVEPLSDLPLRLSGELLAYRWAGQDELPPLLSEHYRVIELALAYRHSRTVPEPVK
jgi:8-oxo-dGTP pyrophosphatase MutT (NUDIX family)